MNKLPNFFCFLSVLSFSSIFHPSEVGFAQGKYNSDYSSSSSRKPIVDYYENVDDKSFYQLKRIHGMKGELNSYSEKLHNLQDRFDKIFYGLSSKGNFKTPFDTSIPPSRPVFEPRTKPLPTYPAAQPQTSPVVDIPREPKPAENQLAFNVDSPGVFTKEDQVISTFNPNNTRGMGYYLVLSPGVAFAHKTHDTAKYHKKSDPGLSTTLAGGFEINNFKIGLGGSYKRHSFRDSSYLKSSSKFLSGDSETFAGYLDLGYNLSISNSWEAYFGIGVGYYLSLVDDKDDLSTRKEHDVFLTGSTGISWRMSELFALSLGYRYFHENEVPAHIAELGANFDF